MLKRAFDITGSGLILFLTFPMLIIVALLIKITSSGSIFYMDQRVGLSGQVFNMYKFRTMVTNADSIGLGRAVNQADTRITWIGHILRKWSIDELPQVINILKKEMSFIGPRPCIPAHYKYYSDYEKQRVALLPGITGWAQIHGRNNLTWEQRIQRDIWYIHHQSFLIDFIIIIRTIITIFSREGVYGIDGTTPSYKGA